MDKYPAVAPAAAAKPFFPPLRSNCCSLCGSLFLFITVVVVAAVETATVVSELAPITPKKTCHENMLVIKLIPAEEAPIHSSSNKQQRVGCKFSGSAEGGGNPVGAVDRKEQDLDLDRQANGGRVTSGCGFVCTC